MGQKLRVEVPGGTSHASARGNARATIFRNETDYLEFVRKFAAVITEARWLCHAYCLMPNHYHLLIETPEPTLAFGMHRLNGRYARWFNRSANRVGRVFQGPYFAEPIESDEHLAELFRYIALNPVRAGLCNDPAEWRWSSYAATIGCASPPSFLTLDRVRALFGPDGLRAAIASV